MRATTVAFAPHVVNTDAATRQRNHPTCRRTAVSAGQRPGPSRNQPPQRRVARRRSHVSRPPVAQRQAMRSAPGRAGRESGGTTARSHRPTTPSRCRRPRFPRRPERLGKVAGGGPPVGGGDEALVGLPGRRDAMAVLVGAQLPGQPPGGRQGAPQSRRRRILQLGRRPVPAARLVDDSRKRRGKFGGRQVLPRSGAQAFGHQQVTFAVDPGQHPAVVRRLHVLAVRLTMKPRSESNPTIRSNVRASELVAAAIFWRSWALSRSTRR